MIPKLVKEIDRCGRLNTSRDWPTVSSHSQRFRPVLYRLINGFDIKMFQKHMFYAIKKREITRYAKFISWFLFIQLPTTLGIVNYSRIQSMCANYPRCRWHINGWQNNKTANNCPLNGFTVLRSIILPIINRSVDRSIDTTHFWLCWGHSWIANLYGK